jgi:hypothetical protein
MLGEAAYLHPDVEPVVERITIATTVAIAGTRPSCRTLW